MMRFSRIFVPAPLLLSTSPLYAQAEAPAEPISIPAFLVMCGFVLLVILMVCSVIAQGLLAYRIVSGEGRFGRAMVFLASVVSDVRIVDGSRNSERRDNKGTRL
jgi:hypothetical protein